MKYIRTKYGRICKIRNKQKRLNGEYDTWYAGNNVSLLYNQNHNLIDKEADTIEELICDDDILYIYDLYPDAVLVVEGNIKPFGYQTKIKLKEWLNYKPKFDLLIKDSNGNYIKMAKTNDRGELELL